MTERHVPIERVTRSLYCPFSRIIADAESSMVSRWGGSTKDLVSEWQYSIGGRDGNARSVAQLSMSTSDFIILQTLDDAYKKKRRPASGETQAGKIVLSYPHLPRFKTGLAGAQKWLGEAFTKEGKIASSHSDAYWLIERLHGNASIGIQPTVREETEEEIGGPGVIMFLNSWEESSETSLGQFEAFVEYMLEFSLQQFALAAAQVVAAKLPRSVPRENAQQPTRGSYR